MVAGLLAADHLFELDADVFELAAELEGHPDNVGAALEGGFVVCNGAQAHRFEAPPGLEAVLVVPDEGPPTEEARDALPATVPIDAAVFNLSHAAMLMLGLATADWDLISAGLHDRLHQPHRAQLYPRSADLLERAKALGALGATISGAGPTVLVWSRYDQTGPLVEALKRETGEWATVMRVRVRASGRRRALALSVQLLALSVQPLAVSVQPLAQPFGVALLELAPAAGEVEDQPEIIVAVALRHRQVQPPHRLDHQLVRELDCLLGRLDQHPSAIGRVGHPPGQPGAFQSVDHRGDRPGGEPTRLGQIASAHAAVLVEDVQAPRVGAIDPRATRRVVRRRCRSPAGWRAPRRRARRTAAGVSVKVLLTSKSLSY